MTDDGSTERQGGRAAALRKPKVWIPGILLLAALAAAIVFVVPRPGADPAGSPTPTPSPTAASPSPSATASSTPEPSATAALVDGFAPVPQLPIAAVPWDQVGPGWFLVDHHAAVEDVLASDLDWAPNPVLDGGVSLVSPDGDWYAVRRHAELGAGPVITWDGVNAWLAPESATNFESVNVRLALANLETGVTESGLTDGVVDGVLRYGYTALGDGAAIALAYGGDGMSQQGAGPRAGAANGCRALETGYYGWVPHDQSFLYSPANGGRMVCFAPTFPFESTRVMLLDVAQPSASEQIAEFRFPIYRYAFGGWIDADRYLVARVGEDRSAPAEAMFIASIGEGTVTEVDLPFYASAATDYAFFDRQSQRHVIQSSGADGAWVVDLYTLEGDEAASLSGTCAGQSGFDQSALVRVSGERLMVTCDDPGTVWMFDTATGDSVGEWDMGDGAATLAFDHPEG